MTLSDVQVCSIFGVLAAIVSLSLSIVNTIRIKDIEDTLCELEEMLDKLDKDSIKQIDLINNLSIRNTLLKQMIDIVFMRTKSKKKENKNYDRRTNQTKRREVC